MLHGECRVCDQYCIWIPAVDGELAEKRVCSPECLEVLNKRVEMETDMSDAGDNK